MGGNYYGDEELESLAELARDPDPAIRALAIAAASESEKARNAEAAASYQPSRSERFDAFIEQRLNAKIAEVEAEENEHA